MRRTRGRSTILAIIFMLLAVLIIKNFVVAGDDDYVYTVDLTATQTDGNTVVATISLSNPTASLQMNVTYPTDLLTLTGSEGLNQDYYNDQGGSIWIACFNPSNQFHLYFSINDGAEGTATLSSSVSGATTIDGDAKSGEQIGGIRSASVEISGGSGGDETSTPAVSTNNITLNINQSADISITNDVAVAWASSDANVAGLSNGNEFSVTVVGLTPGTATIYARSYADLNKYAEITVTVNQGETPEPGPDDPPGPIDPDDPPTPPTPDDPDEPYDPEIPDDPIINPGDLPDIDDVEGAPNITPSGPVSLVVGDTIQMQADQTNILWLSSDTSIATVDARSGLITAVSKGRTIVSVTNGNGRTQDFWVVVNNPQNEQQQNKQSNSDNNNSTNNKTTNTTTENTATNGTVTPNGKANPTADDPVPATGENTAEMLILIAIVMLIVATVIFKKKSRKNR